MASAPSPLLSRVKVLAAKEETTPGTAEALTATEAAFNVEEPKAQSDVETEERQQPGSFKYNPDQPDAGKGQVTFKMEMTGGQALPAWASVLLPACGLSVVSTTHYALDSDPPQATDAATHNLTLGLYINGVKKLLYGAAGNVVFTFTSAKRVMMDFTFSGIWGAPTDVAILAPTLPTDSPLLCRSASCVIGSWSPKFASQTLDLGNEVKIREDQDSATGYGPAVITNRRPKLTLDPEASLVATHDVYGLLAAATTGSWAYTAANGDDDCAFAATLAQFLKVDEGSRDGIETNEIEAALNNEDLTLTFS